MFVFSLVVSLFKYVGGSTPPLLLQGSASNPARPRKTRPPQPNYRSGRSHLQRSSCLKAYRTTRRQTNSRSVVVDWITRGLVNSPTANF